MVSSVFQSGAGGIAAMRMPTLLRTPLRCTPNPVFLVNLFRHSRFRTLLHQFKRRWHLGRFFLRNLLGYQ